MSTTYRTIAGDTYETIARKSYGDETQASMLSKANPGVDEPFAIGTLIVLPDQAGAPQDALQAASSDNPDELAILIDGERFRFWNRVKIVRSMDSFDRAVFSAPFEPANLEFREIFKPFTYKPVVITVGGTPIFTGTMMLPLPSLQPSAKSVRVSCYSQPGVSDDCTAPASAFPIEFNKQGLKEIAQTLLEPFGIPVEFEADQGAVFERVALEPGKKIFSFLIELAQQRNLVIRSTPLGAVAFIRSIATGSPVVQLEQGFSPLLGVEPNFNPQKYHSHITGIDPAAIGSKGSQYTVPNPRLEGVVRPLTFKAKDTDNGSIKAAVEAKAARMFADAASYSIQLDTWRDPAGNLWEPNTSLNLLAPGAMIYNNYEFLVRTVELEADRQSRTATHNLVMPGVFSGQIPESLPWDE